MQEENHPKTRDDLEKEIEELRYRLSRCMELLEQAKCPGGCTGNCVWCYERSVETKGYDGSKQQQDAKDKY